MIVRKTLRLFGATLAGLLLASASPALAEGAATPSAPASEKADGPRVMVMLNLGADHFSAAGDYGGPYGDAMREQARLRIAKKIASAHGLTVLESWPMQMIGVDCVIMAPDMVRPYQTYRIPVVWESWGVLSIDAGSLEQAAALALDSEMPLPDQKEYVDESIRVDWESVGGCNAPMPDDSADMLCVRGHLGQSE